MFVARNIVATVNLGCVLNLKTIAMHARNAEYNPKRFAAVIMRIRYCCRNLVIFYLTRVKPGHNAGHDDRLVGFMVRSVGYHDLSWSLLSLQGSENHCFDLWVRQNGLHRRQKRGVLIWLCTKLPGHILREFYDEQELARLAARKYARIIQKIGFAVRPNRG